MRIDKLCNKYELKRQELTYYELPNLIHSILQISLISGMNTRKYLEKDIEEIKRIVDTESNSALSRFEECKENKK